VIEAIELVPNDAKEARPHVCRVSEELFARHWVGVEKKA
jgi:hypothetical protein